METEWAKETDNIHRGGHSALKTTININIWWGPQLLKDKLTTHKCWYVVTSTDRMVKCKERSIADSFSLFVLLRLFWRKKFFCTHICTLKNAKSFQNTCQTRMREREKKTSFLTSSGYTGCVCSVLNHVSFNLKIQRSTSYWTVTPETLPGNCLLWEFTTYQMCRQLLSLMLTLKARWLFWNVSFLFFSTFVSFFWKKLLFCIPLVCQYTP